MHRQSGYRPGTALLALSRNVSLDECLRVASNEILPALARELNASVHLTRLDREMLLYVAKADTPQSCAVSSNAGLRYEPYSLAPGKLLLSALAPKSLEAFFKSELIALTPYTITDRTLLLSELADIRRDGFASDNQEFHLSMSSIALPVRDCEGRIIASLSATELPHCMTQQRHTQLKDALARGANEIAIQLFKEARSALPTLTFSVEHGDVQEFAEAYA